MFNLNGQISASFPAAIYPLQRPLYYADALFETLRAFDGGLPLLNRHWARLAAGMKALDMAIPVHWSTDFFQQEMEKLGVDNARVRLSVWRDPGGRLLPESSAVSFLIEASALPDNAYTWNERGLQIGICDNVRLAADELSQWKTLNMARYAHAARNAHALGWDDALLLNAQGRVVESSIFNVFWVKKGQVFTPPTQEGCVAGVMRAYLLEKLPEWGFAVATQTVSPEELMAADEVFLTNAVRGVQWVAQFSDKGYHARTTNEIFIKMRASLRLGPV